MTPIHTQVWLLLYNMQERFMPDGGWRLTSDSDQKRLTAIRHEDTRAQFALTRLLIPWVLHKQFGSHSAKWTIGYNEKGRPELGNSHCNVPDISISHTSGMVAFAMTDMGIIGVDVENQSRKVDIELISREVFSKEESARFHRLSSLGQRSFFFQRWTLKEAYTKALGLGLYAGFKSIEIENRPGRNDIRLKRSASDDQHPSDSWRFYHDLHFTSFHVAVALLVDADHPKTLCWQIQPTLIDLAGQTFKAICLSLDDPEMNSAEI